MDAGTIAVLLKATALMMPVFVGPELEIRADLPDFVQGNGECYP